jgi:uncharacterized protein
MYYLAMDKETAAKTCPICGKSIKDEAVAFPPFCSNRCHLIDLGAWLNESYAIASEETSEESQDNDDSK